MCHESSGVALGETIGIGKGTVSITDIHEADLLIVAGQNPGTNHPRMLSALERAKANGATIIAVNPLPEAGLTRFKNPQTPKGMILGGTKLADRYVQIRLGGDQALFQAIGKHLLEADATRERRRCSTAPSSTSTPTASRPTPRRCAPCRGASWSRPRGCRRRPCAPWGSRCGARRPRSSAGRWA